MVQNPTLIWFINLYNLKKASYLHQWQQPLPMQPNSANLMQIHDVMHYGNSQWESRVWVIWSTNWYSYLRDNLRIFNQLIEKQQSWPSNSSDALTYILILQ